MFYYLQRSNNYLSIFNELNLYKLIEKKSVFTSYIYSISNKNEAEEYIKYIRNENKDARHVVYIYSYFENGICNIRSDDDGEPQGTGTKAIYELLDKEHITNVCIIIVRYFGGILLGAGPLSRAYLNSARGAIDGCVKKELYNYVDFEFLFEYNLYDILKNKLLEFINDNIVKVEEEQFKDKIYLKVKIVDNRYEEIKNIIYNIIR